MINNPNEEHIRSGCTDMWNAFMVRGAQFVLGSDIPICPCTAKTIPKKCKKPKQLSEEALQI